MLFSDILQQRISSIPEGDKGKIKESTTTMRRNFDVKPNYHIPYDKLEAMSALHNTNFKLTDKENLEYLSIQEDSFRPVNLLSYQGNHICYTVMF